VVEAPKAEDNSNVGILTWNDDTVTGSPRKRSILTTKDVKVDSWLKPRTFKIKPPIPPIPRCIKTPISDFILSKNKKGEAMKRARVLTGLNTEQRESLWDFLGPARVKLKIIGTTPPQFSGEVTSLSVQCQFLLMLWILRRNPTYEVVGVNYNIDPGLVSKVFKTWLQFVYFKFLDVKDKMFVRQVDIKKPLPSHFRNKLLRKTRVVIDCTEFGLESTLNFDQQGNIYSFYKTKPTAKLLLGVVPSGGACYISHAFEGCISDREIVRQSGFLDYLEPGDIVLADRGFKGADEFIEEKGATLIIPPFLRGRKKFTLEEEHRTRIIAKARIHIERFNKRIKIYEFLKGPIRHCHVPLVSQAVYVCSCLANFSLILAQ
jgi:hypothetical protein